MMFNPEAKKGRAALTRTAPQKRRRIAPPQSTGTGRLVRQPAPGSGNRSLAV